MYFDLLHLKNDLSQKGIFFEFSGPLTQSLLVELGDILKLKMKLESASTLTILKVFALVVEQTQNIIHYSAEKQNQNPAINLDLSTGIIAVGYKDREYFVQAGNLMETDDVARLKSKLNLLKTMDAAQLKKLYKEQRRKDPGEKSKGGGLGFIEIARKSSRPIEFDFAPVDEKYSFFSLNAHIS